MCLGARPHIASPICHFVVRSDCCSFSSRKLPHITENFTECALAICHIQNQKVILLYNLLFVLQGSWVLPLRRISTASSTLRPGTIFCRCLCAARCRGTASSPTLIPKVRAKTNMIPTYHGISRDCTLDKGELFPLNNFLRKFLDRISFYLGHRWHRDKTLSQHHSSQTKWKLVMNTQTKSMEAKQKAVCGDSCKVLWPKLVLAEGHAINVPDCCHHTV